jgi:hypothetical protein
VTNGGRFTVAAIAVVAGVALPITLHAQITDPNPHDAQPERPSVATHAWTVAARWIEIEAGTEFDRYDEHAHGETAPLVAKLGLTRRTQLELQTPIVYSRGLHAAAGDLLVGVKWRAVERAPVVATIAVFPTIKFPTGSTDLGAGTGTTDLGVVLISSREFGGVSLDLNAGFTHRMGDAGFAPHDSSVWAMAFGGPAHGPVGWVAELFGYPPTSGPSGDRAVVAALCGPTMKLRGWLVFDTGVIVPIEGPQPKAIYAGAVYNIGRLGHRQ